MFSQRTVEILPYHVAPYSQGSFVPHRNLDEISEVARQLSVGERTISKQDTFPFTTGAPRVAQMIRVSHISSALLGSGGLISHLRQTTVTEHCTSRPCHYVEGP